MNLVEHLKRQIAFSRATFGPGTRMDGVIDHIKKELAEVAAGKSDYERSIEWVDVVILALDGLTRSLSMTNPTTDAVAEQAVRMIIEKQNHNERRKWPDWRTADPDKAIEHVRTGESTAS